MKRLLLMTGAVIVSVATIGLGGEAKKPEQLGAHWARVSDEAQIQMIVDEMQAVARGKVSAGIARTHLAGQLPLSSVVKDAAGVSKAATGMPAIDIRGTSATAEFSGGGMLRLEKTGGKWAVVGGSVDIPAPAARTGLSMGSGQGVSVGETFIHTPVSREHDIDRLSRSVTQSKINRQLFAVPDKPASYYYAHYMNNAPYVEATYIQFVTDPEWNRIVYGNMDHWLKSYGNVKGPSAIAVDADGRVFVGETGNKRVSVLRVIGSGDGASLQPQFTIEGMTTPSDIALDDRGTPLATQDDQLYVADASENKVYKFGLGASGAVLLATFDGFDAPTAILVGRWQGANNGILYVVDKLAKRIRAFEDLGAGLSPIGEVDGDYSQYFKSIKADHFGNIYVVDNVNSRLFKFTSSLELLDAEGGDGVFATLGNVDIPFGKIVVDGQGTYWAGFDQAFAVEQWGDASGAQRRTLGLKLKNIEYRADKDISAIEDVFTMTDFGSVTVRVYDGNGRPVRNLGSSWRVAGEKSIVWDRRNDAGALVPPGTYREEISATSAYRDEPVISNTRFYLPMFYWENSGGNSTDDAHLVQGSAVTWGTTPSQTANEHASSVAYRFTGLNPESDYEVSAEFASGDGLERLQDMTANGARILEPVAVTSAPARTDYVKLPKESYAHGEVTIGINRLGQGTAIVTQLWFKESGVAFTPVPVNEAVPTAYRLDQNYPNPFNPSTVIRYAIPNDGPVTLRVFSITGQEVATLVNEQQHAGVYDVRFDAGSTGKSGVLASGVYFYQVKAGDFTSTRKMLLVK